MIPNTEQQASINAIDGVYVVIAGPGSGKTTVLIERHRAMLMRGINPSEILNLTFTNAAAKNMAKRSGVLDAEDNFRTFHSFAMEFLWAERNYLPFKLAGQHIIPTEGEDHKLFGSLAKHYPVKNWRKLREQISEWKRANISPEQAILTAGHDLFFYAKAYEEYEQTCRADGWLDFDSIMSESVRLLTAYPEIRARHQRRYLAVDEAQDTDTTQFHMLQLLFVENIFVVGDENQLIYVWRSARPGNLSHFSAYFPNAQKLYLGQNYRSTNAILTFLKEILPEDNGLESRMVTLNGEGVSPTFVRYPDDHQEALSILAKLTDPENTAVISRTNRQLYIFERLCRERQIKYNFLGKKHFWQQNEVKHLLKLAKQRIHHDTRPAAVVLAELVRNHNLIEVYRNAGEPMEASPAENLNGIVKLAADKGDTATFLKYLEKLTRARQSAKGLTLATAHQAKGGEWKHVFVIGAKQGIMPHKDGDLPEERRIFFVACSRAAERLEVSFYGERSMLYETRWKQIQIYTGAEANGTAA